MPIAKNPGRLTALVAALSLVGCGSNSGDKDGGDCPSDKVERGCVDIMNFRSTTQEFGGVVVPARSKTATGTTAPGLKSVKLDDSSLNSKHDFKGTIAGQSVSVTCTVSDLGWISVNPSVILQQEAFGALVNCSNW